MQHSSQIKLSGMLDTMPAEGLLPLGAGWLLVALGLIVLSSFPLVPPVDVLDGGTTTRGFIEFGLILAGLALLLICLKAQGSFSFDLKSPPFLIVTVFTAWSIVSSIWSPNPVLTIAKSAELWCIAVAALVFVTLAARAGFTNGKLETILGLSMVAVLCGLIVANIYYWGVPLPTTGDAALPLELMDEEASPERPRLILAYQHPLLTGDLLALAAISLFVSGLRKTWKAILITGVAVLMWLADARGPTGGMIVSMVALAFLKLRKNDVRAIAVMLAISIALAVALFFQNHLPADMSALMSDDVPTLNSRTDLWAKAVSHVLDQPLLGTGYYASRYLLVKDFPWGGHAHNSFLEVQLTTGVIGLLMLCAFVGYVFKEIFTTRNALLLGVTLYCLIQGTLNPLLFYPGLAMFVITIAVLNAGLSNGDVKRVESDRESNFHSER
ncbi:MAG TPA: O-antigen ligase family protein [Pyrinomonadaceae bacterium]|nr:O-antigen ligase family protein [Pyrinomonadaceae bacterium]